MTAQKGKDLLLKVDTNGAGSFVTVAGLRARTLAFNAATVDVTDTESVGRWRELLDGALADLIAKAPVIFGGLGLAALGAKVNDASQPAPQTIKSTKTK
jgi:predicted secreted protein